MVNLYAFYVLEIALRIAVLEVIGVNVSDDVKNYVMAVSYTHLDVYKRQNITQVYTIIYHYRNLMILDLLEGKMI